MEAVDGGEAIVTMRQVQREARAWFTPREPDWAVRQWGYALMRAGRQRVLDVGCGSGRHTVFLVELGLSVTAGDVSTLALAETRRWLAREQLEATLVQLEMTALPFQSEAFDAVLSVNVLHPARLEQARAAVGEIWRVLRPGGSFLAVLSGAGDCHCLLERPAASALAACPHRANEGDLYSLFAHFRILETQRPNLGLSKVAGPLSWRGINWRIWAERPAL